MTAKFRIVQPDSAWFPLVNYHLQVLVALSMHPAKRRPGRGAGTLEQIKGDRPDEEGAAGVAGGQGRSSHNGGRDVRSERDWEARVDVRMRWEMTEGRSLRGTAAHQRSTALKHDD